jgi:predicted N-formylglutamate amidohydrolase
MQSSFLGTDEPHPVLLENPNGRSPLLLTADHAGRRIPRALGDLGVPEHELRRHIGWDIGIWEVSRRVATALDTVLIGQSYSRLVIDCNRNTNWPGSVPEISESTPIPGNVGISDAARAARIAEIFTPYHERIEAEIAARAGKPVAYIAMHSMTNIYKGVPRPWQISVLYGRDDRLSRILLELLRAEPGLCVGENEPYIVNDSTDYGVPVHAERRGLPYLEIEFRQDLIEDSAGQQFWADLMIRLLPETYRRFVAQHGEVLA